MALEELLREHIGALERNTDATNRLTSVSENMMNLRAEAIDAIKETGKGKPAAKVKATDTQKREITDNPEDRKDSAAKGSGAADTKTSKAEAPDHADLAKVIKGYVGMDDDKGRRENRTANVRKIFGHKKVDAAAHTDVPAAMIAVVISNIEKLHTEAIAESASNADSGDDLLGDT